MGQIIKQRYLQKGTKDINNEKMGPTKTKVYRVAFFKNGYFYTYVNTFPKKSLKTNMLKIALVFLILKHMFYLVMFF